MWCDCFTRIGLYQRVVSSCRFCVFLVFKTVNWVCVDVESELDVFINHIRDVCFVLFLLVLLCVLFVFVFVFICCDVFFPQHWCTCWYWFVLSHEYGVSFSVCQLCLGRVPCIAVNILNLVRCMVRTPFGFVLLITLNYNDSNCI